MRQKHDQLRQLLRQSYDLFNVYGKEPEQLRNVLHGFTLALEDQLPDDIQAAFTVWLKENSTLPTPSDIRKLAIEAAKDRLAAAGNYARAVPADPVPRRAVQWAGKHWNEFTSDDMRALQEHLLTFDTDEARRGYETYLIQWCGVQKDWLGIQ